mmetsp:Transcript_36376/g.79587  ORF Transcript_36376/g.79587 Transcript_36376/m.79587 type:complete len:194 (+) Transcript_36376:94-675(+)
MVKLGLLAGALLATSASAFAPAASQAPRVALQASSVDVPEVDATGNNIAVKNLLTDIEASGLLSQVAQAGLLSKAQASGISLTKLEPLLALAAGNKDVMILVESAGPELLPILPTVVEIAPGALPLLGAAIQLSPAALQVAGLASLAAAAGAVYLIPDDTVVEVATQTLAVGALGAAAGASFVGSAVLGKLTA